MVGVCDYFHRLALREKLVNEFVCKRHLLFFFSVVSFGQNSISRNEKLISELEPSFPGGAKALREFVNKNLKYPKNGCVEGTTLFHSLLIKMDLLLISK